MKKEDFLGRKTVKEIIDWRKRYFASVKSLLKSERDFPCRQKVVKIREKKSLNLRISKVKKFKLVKKMCEK